MWNSDNPLKIYLSMSKEATDEELKRLQAVIDEDKELDSRRNGRDVCGEYAPFCEYCDKSLSYSCARAYIKMKTADCYIAVEREKAVTMEEAPIYDVPVDEIPMESSRIYETKVTEEEVKEVDAYEIAEEVTVKTTEEPVTIVEDKPQKKIRIAHIKRVK